MALPQSPCLVTGDVVENHLRRGLRIILEQVLESWQTFFTRVTEAPALLYPKALRLPHIHWPSNQTSSPQINVISGNLDAGC